MWIVCKGVSESRKDVSLKIPSFCPHEAKKFRLLWKNEGYIEYASKSPTLGCRVIAAHFNIEKASASNILKNAKTLQYHLINEILINWYKNVLVQVYFRMALCWRKKRWL